MKHHSDGGRYRLPAATWKQIAAIASYIRNAWGNVGGAVTKQQVLEQR
jgi:mono/diheme cytochrome c family protein